MKNVVKGLLSFMLFCLLANPLHADNAKGEEAYANGDYETAFAEFSKAAEEGDMNAQYNLAVMYEKGQGVDQSDLKAEHWYQSAADQGHPGAPIALQLLFEHF